MRNIKLYITVLVAIVTLSVAANAQFGPSKPIVSGKASLSSSKLKQGSSFTLVVKATIRKGYHVGAADKDALYPAKMTLSAPKGISFGKPVFSRAERKTFPGAPNEKIPVYEGSFTVKATGRVSKTMKPGPVTIIAKLNTQACGSNQCYPPETTTLKVNANVVSTHGAAAASGAPGSNSGAASVSEDQRMASRLEHKGVLFSLVTLYGLGLLLAFSPCVYPMVPITVGYFGSQSESRKKRVVLLAGVYVLGLALTYSVLGAIAATTGSVFGSAMQKPGVLIGISAILVALALSMFGLYEIRPPAFVENQSSGRSGVLGALLMGLIFGVVAAPCAGPVVLGVLLYIAKLGSPLMGFLLFFALAVGMGTPLFFLAAFSAKMPLPGMWMVAVKKIAGFLLLGAAVYFVAPLFPEPMSRFFIPMVVVVGGIYLGFFEKSIRSSRLATSLGRVGGSAALILGVMAVMPGQSQSKLTWEPYTPAKVVAAAKAGKPVMVDFTAAWCGVCKELEHGAFSNTDVIRSTDHFVRLRADGTDRSNSIIQTAEKRFGVGGYPTVIIIDGSGKEQKSLRVTGNISAKEMVRRLEAVK